MARKKRRTFSAEFKSETVKLVKAGDKSIAQVATPTQATAALPVKGDEINKWKIQQPS